MPAALEKSTTQLMGIIIKQCLRTEQDTWSLCRAIFDTIVMAMEHDVVKSMREQTRRYDEGVQAAGQVATHGSTSDLGTVRIDRRSPEAGGSSRSGRCSDSDRLLEATQRHEHGHEVRSCEVLHGRSDLPVRASSHHSGGRQVRRTRPSRERAASVGSSTRVRQSTTDPTVSRSPTVAGHPARQVGSGEGMLRAVSVWLGDHSSKPEVVVDGAERGSATYGAGFKGEHRVSFSARVSCLFSGTVFVGRRDARREVCVSLADFFGVERDPATILSRCFAELWEQCLFWSEWGTVDPLGSEHLVLLNRRVLTTAPRLCYLGCWVVPRLVLLCCQRQSQLELWRVRRPPLRRK